MNRFRPAPRGVFQRANYAANNRTEESVTGPRRHSRTALHVSGPTPERLSRRPIGLPLLVLALALGVVGMHTVAMGSMSLAMSGSPGMVRAADLGEADMPNQQMALAHLSGAPHLASDRVSTAAASTVVGDCNGHPCLTTGTSGADAPVGPPPLAARRVLPIAETPAGNASWVARQPSRALPRSGRGSLLCVWRV